MKSDRILRSKIQRLAATHPEFRRVLTPLLRTAAPSLTQPEYGDAVAHAA
jgi:uncharacterized protein (UPF0216 family)